MSDHSNGQPGGLPGDQFQETMARRREYDVETRAEVVRREQRLEALKEEREQCRKDACNHAGNLGLVYRAETNDYVRMVATTDAPPLRSEPIEAPEPLAPPAPTSVLAKMGVRRSDRVELALWFFALVIGSFVGVGLVTLAGFNVYRQPWTWVAAPILGFTVMASLKLFLTWLWELMGRRDQLEGTNGKRLALAFGVTVLLCALEAWLGAQALILYSQRMAFEASEALSPATAFPIAVAVSTALLAAVSIRAYSNAPHSITDREIEESERRRALEREDEHWKKLETHRQERYRRSIERQSRLDEEAAKRYEEERQEFQQFKKQPDFVTLLKYIGRIGAINVQIAEEEKTLQSYKISRGFGRSQEHAVAGPSEVGDPPAGEGPYAL